MRKSNKMKFANAASARTHGAAMYANGDCDVWCEYRCGKYFTLRYYVAGRWQDLLECH